MGVDDVVFDRSHDVATLAHSRRRDCGLRNHALGSAAENLVADYYAKSGAVLLAQRWRSASGEIDLIMDHAGCIVFVEVKMSASLSQAAGLIKPAQVRRLFKTAQDYFATHYGHCDIECRFDLVLVDKFARMDVIENAFIEGYF